MYDSGRTNGEKQIDRPLTDKKSTFPKFDWLIVPAHLRYEADVLFNNLLSSLFVFDIID